MDQASIKKALADFFNLLRTDEEVKPTIELFHILENYANARAMEIFGQVNPIHVFFKQCVKIEKPNGYVYSYIRYNPETKEPCNRDWPGLVRAFSTEDGEVYVDLDIEDNNHRLGISKYTKIDHLIDFAFTLEHELTHIKQFEEEKKAEKEGKPTYDAVKTARDLIAIYFSKNTPSKNGQVFYMNGHNRFHIEMDANKHAEEYLRKQLLLRGLMSRKVEAPGSQKEHFMFDIFNRRVKEGQTSINRDERLFFTTLFGFDEKHLVDLTADPEKIIKLLVDASISLYPKDYLNSYPILRYIYNPNGTRKTYQEIKQAIADNPDLVEFYDDVIADDALLSIQRIEDERITTYLASNKRNEQQQILNNGLSKIKEIVDQETVDIDSIILYLDKRSRELDEAEIDEKQKSTSKLIYLVTKQAILRKDEIKVAYQKMGSFKEDVIQAQEVVSRFEAIDFAEQTPEEIYGYLDIMKSRLKIEKTFHYYKDKGLSPEEIQEFEHAVDICLKFYSNKKGYRVTGSRPAKKELRSLLKGLNSLYDTKYYKEKIMNNTSDDIDISILRNDFELANQIYIESQKLVGLGGIDEHSFVAQVGDSPLISTVLRETPGIVDILCEIRDMEEYTPYLDRLDWTINLCKNYIKANQQTKRG